MLKISFAQTPTVLHATEANVFFDLKDMFSAISDLEYAVLRHFDGILEPNYLHNHPDIDLLCSCPDEIVKRLSLTPRNKGCINYTINIDETVVSVDLRSVGDNYYDINWEKAMLKERILTPDGIYVLDPINYLYSLLYHITVQDSTSFKIDPSGSMKFIYKLAQDNGIALGNDYIEALNDYMLANNYQYTFPKYELLYPVNFRYVNQDLIEKNIRIRIMRLIYRIFSAIRNIMWLIRKVILFIPKKILRDWLKLV